MPIARTRSALMRNEIGGAESAESDESAEATTRVSVTRTKTRRRRRRRSRSSRRCSLQTLDIIDTNDCRPGAQSVEGDSSDGATSHTL
mmetsp:Transcript_1286/g.3036  ORF Transcript_1286/g.3036 Transcript_1286/m.3036 type:complete len:88 (+) Transcript_1286:73-336(+)